MDRHLPHRPGQVEAGINAKILEVYAFEMLRVEPVDEGVSIDYEAGQGQRLDGEAIQRTAHDHGADFGFLNGGLVEVLACSDFGVKSSIACMAAVEAS